MTIERSYSSGWGIGDMYTSAQANALDTSLTYAVDGRTGGYTGLVGSDLAFAGQYTGGIFRGATMIPNNFSVASGFAQLGSDARLASTQRAGWLVGMQTLRVPTGTKSLSSSYTRIDAGLNQTNVTTAISAGFSVATGDRITVDGSIVWRQQPLLNGAAVGVAIRIDGASGTFHPPGCVRRVIGSGLPTNVTASIAGMFVATSAGTAVCEIFGSGEFFLVGKTPEEGGEGVQTIPPDVDVTAIRFSHWRL